MSTVSVLIVDDFDAWRRFMIEQLNQHEDMYVLGTASDGLEGVQKAEELQPDLIMLDIGLPKLNGIEMARRVRKLIPKAKILFLSSNADADVVRAAFSAGGSGYILKAEAGEALPAGIEAVRMGKRFLSNGLTGFVDLSNLGRAET